MGLIMGEKTRENFRIDFCIKFKCINRGLLCDTCINYSNEKYRSKDGEKNSNKS